MACVIVFWAEMGLLGCKTWHVRTNDKKKACNKVLHIFIMNI